MLVDIFLLITGILSALIIPYLVYRRIKKYIRFHPRLQTLSYLGNKWIFGRKISNGYKIVLFLMAFLTLCFFWLLTEKFELKGHQSIFKWLTYSVSLLVALAFFPHNMKAFKWHNFSQNLVRILHNLSAVLVFISLAVLILIFQIEIIDERRFVGIGGLVIIGLTIIFTLAGILVYGKINSITEEIYILGICSWEIFIVIYVVFI